MSIDALGAAAVPPPVAPAPTPAPTPAADTAAQTLGVTAPSDFGPRLDALWGRTRAEPSAPQRLDALVERHDAARLGADASAGANPFQRMKSVGEVVQTRVETISEVRRMIRAGEVDADDPAARGLLEQQSAELLGLQIEMSQATFGVQLMTKLIEQGTSGAKTLVQTQV